MKSDRLRERRLLFEAMRTNLVELADNIDKLRRLGQIEVSESDDGDNSIIEYLDLRFPEIPERALSREIPGGEPDLRPEDWFQFLRKRLDAQGWYILLGHSEDRSQRYRFYIEREEISSQNQ